MGKLKFRLGMTTAVVVLAVGVWSMFAHPWGWAYGIGVHPYPASSSTPWTYQLLSGFIPALTVISLLTLIAGGWHHLNCHQGGCPRIGRHHVNGQVWCNVHHTHVRPERTENELLELILARLTSINQHLDASEQCENPSSSSSSE